MMMHCWIQYLKPTPWHCPKTRGDKCPQDSMPRTLWGFGLQLATTPRQVLFLLLALCQQQSGGDTSHMQWLGSLSLIDRGQSQSVAVRGACMRAFRTRQYNADRALIFGPCSLNHPFRQTG